MGTQWFENFFHGIANELWAKCVPPELTRAEVAFLVRMLKCKRGARILDVPCGNGRHSIALARKGYKPTGIDISKEYIETAQRAAKAARVSVEWVCSDMRRLQGRGEFDGAFCFGNAFGYCEHEDSRAFLKAVARALKPGSRFAFHAAAAELVLPRFREREWVQVEDILFLEANEYSVERSCIETTYTFIRNGKVDVRHGRQFIYTTAEIGRMLAEAGFHRTKIYGGVNGENFQVGKDTAIFVAETVE